MAASAVSLQQVLGLGGYLTAWTWLHKLRRAMIRPGRDRLRGRVEVDETYVGGEGTGLHHDGRHIGSKALVVIGGRRQWTGDRKDPDGTHSPSQQSRSLQAFVKDSVEPSSTVHTDGLRAYGGLDAIGYKHHVSVLLGQGEDAAVRRNYRGFTVWLPC